MFIIIIAAIFALVFSQTIMTVDATFFTLLLAVVVPGAFDYL
jgi:hypothetical protein